MSISESYNANLKTNNSTHSFSDSIRFSHNTGYFGQEKLNNTTKCDTMCMGGQNMSALMMYYDKKIGATIVSDSRMTKGMSIDDHYQKVYINKNIIIGCIGLYSFTYDNEIIKFDDLIINAMLNGSTIKEAVYQEYKGKPLKEYIPKDEHITIFYAKKDSEVGVFDIYTEKPLTNLVHDECDIFSNIPKETKPLYQDYLKQEFITNKNTDNLEINQQRLISIMEVLLCFEKNKEKCYLSRSAIGGNVQFASIKFDKAE